MSVSSSALWLSRGEEAPYGCREVGQRWVVDVPERLLLREEPPQPLDQVQDGCIRRQEHKPHPVAAAGQPIPDRGRTVVGGVVQHDTDDGRRRVPLSQGGEQPGHLGRGDPVRLLRHYVPVRPTRRPVQRDVDPAVVAPRHLRLAALHPAAGRVGVVGRVGCIDEVERLLRVGGGLGHQGGERVLEEGPLRPGIGLGGDAPWPLPDKAHAAQQLGHRVRRVG